MKYVCYRNNSIDIYDEYFDKLNKFKNDCEDRLKNEQVNYLQKSKETNKQKRTTLIFFAVLVVLVCGIVTVILDLYCFPNLDNYQYMEVTNGKDVICYITDYGDCYHKAGCKYLRSSNKTTMYEAEKSGYKPCSVCWTYPKANWRTIKGVNYFGKTIDLLKWILPIAIVLYIFLCVITNKHFKEKANKEETNFLNYKKSIIEEFVKEYGGKDNFISTAKSLSSVPPDVEYKNGLPYTEDERFIVYRSIYGKCFHSYKICRNNYLTIPIHAFKAINCLEPCYYCAEIIDVPEWHSKFTDLYELYNCIINLCK